MTKSPAFLELRRVQAARDISSILSQSRNRVFLEADTLLLNLTGSFDENLEKRNNNLPKKITQQVPQTNNEKK